MFLLLVKWEPSEDVFGEGGISTRPSALLDLVLGAWETHCRAVAASAWEPVGVPCASLCCGLVGDVTEITSQHVRSSYMILLATQNKSATEQEGGRKLSADRIWAKCCGKIHLSCTQCCTKTRFPDSERVEIAHYLHPSLIEMAILLSHLFPDLFIEIQKVPCFSSIMPSSLLQNIQIAREAKNFSGIKHIIYE